MDKNKVIFLDIDGVLNYEGVKARFRGFWGIDPEKVKLLNEIIERTGAKVVFSSTWRTFKPREEVMEYFKAQGMKADFIGDTPQEFQGFSHHRGFEIAAYLKEHRDEISNFVVLDDDPRAGTVQNHIQTDICVYKERKLKNGGPWEVDVEKSGLTKDHVEEAVRLLNE